MTLAAGVRFLGNMAKRHRTGEGSVLEQESPLKKQKTDSSEQEKPAEEPLQEKQTADSSDQKQQADSCDQKQPAHELLQDLGLPAKSQDLLQPLLQRWSRARLPELLGLHTALGDGPGGQMGILRERFETTLQVWGPSGTGKTKVVSNYLDVLDIPHIWIDGFCIASQAELHGRVAKLMSRLADQKATGVAQLMSRLAELHGRVAKLVSTAPDVSRRQLRSLDRFEAALQGSLDSLERSGVEKVVIVIDHIEELPRRLGQGALERLLSWPEVLCKGNLLSLLTIGRVPLQPCVGLLDSRAPPEVVFRPYSDRELEELLLRLLPATPQLAGIGRRSLEAVVYGGLLKFAVPFLGHNLDSLLSVGRDVIVAIGNKAPPSSDGLQKLVGEALKRRTGLLHVGSGLGSAEDRDARSTHAVAAVNVKSMTKAEMRLGLAVYLGSHLDKMDDRQLFLPEGERRRRRRQPVTKHRRDDGVPVHAKAPRTVPLSRLLAIYHRLARQPQVLGTNLFDTLASLRESGFVRLLGESKSCKLDREVKIACQTELPMAVAWAKELKVDLAEYLSK